MELILRGVELILQGKPHDGVLPKFVSKVRQFRHKPTGTAGNVPPCQTQTNGVFMNNHLWKRMWKNNEIGFHQPLINPLLRRCLPRLGLRAQQKILVPLCGKSLDMNFLADEGYRVFGVELSKIAIQSYFDARKVKPSRQKRGRFTIWCADNIEIWCGDIFDLSARDLNPISMLYDCTSLTAFSSSTRPQYVRHFYEKLSQQSQIMLMTTESINYAQPNSALTIDSEVQSLYEKHYHIQLLHGQTNLTVDPACPSEGMAWMEEKVYLIKNL